MSQKKEECSSSSDESLDLTSAKFDALRALYSRKVKIPVPDARPLDNIAAYESMKKRQEGIIKPPKKSYQTQRLSSTDQSTGSTSEKAGTSRDASPSSSIPPGRRFLPHQENQPLPPGEMIPAKKKDPKSNLLSRMPASKPPFQRLWQSMEGPTRTRVRVGNIIPVGSTCCTTSRFKL
ncbi:U7 snRNA-associated Sm-like protein LSm11 [Frankliniella fusca]|uniref:U7 snRNA-associated Sm-like protein LSm11 n=1 Tax=Frankliniella fusca TaxID=407009 RepID=A0AAE1HWL6_9NEOP|nr:U7 snRNA-associated Sm-like protein LSm11 [Frankliniella fusca]